MRGGFTSASGRRVRRSWWRVRERPARMSLAPGVVMLARALCTFADQPYGRVAVAPAPLVSVVIGTLNRRWHLQRAIESVRAEVEPPESEIVVVDGGSDDGTLQWLGRQKDVLTIVQHN